MPTRHRSRSRAVVATLSVLTLLLVALVQSVAAAPEPDPRIIGGEPTGVGEYPFMVALLLEPRGETDFDKQYLWRLADRARRWVLTAAHCVDFVTSPSEITVVAGTHKSPVAHRARSGTSRRSTSIRITIRMRSRPMSPLIELNAADQQRRRRSSSPEPSNDGLQAGRYAVHRHRLGQHGNANEQGQLPGRAA